MSQGYASNRIAVGSAPDKDQVSGTSDNDQDNGAKKRRKISKKDESQANKSAYSALAKEILSNKSFNAENDIKVDGVVMELLEKEKQEDNADLADAVVPFESRAQSNPQIMIEDVETDKEKVSKKDAN